MKAPFRIISKDTIFFEVDKDSAIRAKRAALSDTTFIWAIYFDQGYMDFWGTEKLNPKNEIRTYFKKNKIVVADIYIYSSEPGDKSFFACGFCYGGIDFLFKVKRTDFYRFSKHKIQLIGPLSCNYH
jgi:hypothetical protein